MNLADEPTSQVKDENSNTDDANLKKFQSINDFRNNVKRFILYDESRQSMISLYHGTKNEEWFLDEVIQNFDKLISYESGVQFISSINSLINDDYPAWTEAIFSHYSVILKYNCGFKLLRANIHAKRNSDQATRLIENVFDNFEELKKNENYFDFFSEVLKIYKGNETVREILNSFDWQTDKITLNYLSCFCHYFPVREIQFLTPYIDVPFKFTDNEANSSILKILLSYSDDKIAEQVIHMLIPHLPSFFNSDFLNELVIIIIDHATAEQHFSIYTAFDIALRKKNTKYANNFDLAVLRAVESMNWEQRFEFLSAHFSYFENCESKKINNLLKTMELNEKNHKK